MGGSRCSHKPFKNHGPIAFDGFNAKKALPLEFMNDMNKGVVWAEKANKFEVDIDHWVDQLNRTDETATFDIKAEEYYYVEDKPIVGETACVRPFQASLDGDGRLNIVERSAMGMGKTYRTMDFIINMRELLKILEALVGANPGKFHPISLTLSLRHVYYVQRFFCGIFRKFKFQGSLEMFSGTLGLENQI